MLIFGQIIVDFIAFNLVKEKKVYNNHKYEFTSEYQRGSIRMSKYRYVHA